MKPLQLLFFLLTCLASSGQTTYIPAEKYLLHLLINDTVTSSTIYFPDGIDFDIKWRGQTNVIAAREKSSQYFLVQGTHRVYTLSTGPENEPVLKRIDSSDFYGDNYNCMAFLHRDTLFEYGGYGFWKYRDFFTRYRPLSGDWEFVQGGNSLENSRTISWLDRDKHHFYTAGRFSLNPFVSFNPVYDDSIHLYDLNTRKWTLLGKLAYEPLQTYREWVLRNTWSTPYGTGLALPNNLYAVIDFRNNRVIHIKKEVEEILNSMRETATRRVQNGKSFWFYLHDNLFHLSFTENEFNVNHVRFDSTSLDFTRTQPLYIPAEKKMAGFFPGALTSINLIAGIFFLAAGLTIGWWLSRKKLAMMEGKEISSPVMTEPATIPFYSGSEFRTSLNSVEMEFLNELIRHSLEGKKMPTTVINKLLGVSGKDPEIQKARRSNAITRINKLYAGIAGQEVILINRIRDPYDKRSYLYYIDSANVGAVTVLLKTDPQDLL